MKVEGMERKRMKVEGMERDDEEYDDARDGLIGFD